MKNALLLLFAGLLSNASFGQVIIKNDSLFVDGAAVAAYGLGENERTGVVVEVKVINQPSLATAKNEFEQQVQLDLLSKPFIQSKRIYFEYKIHSDAATLGVIGEAGEILENAGRDLNAAIAIGFVSSAGGTALALTGFPIASAVVSLGGSLIAFIVHVSGNVRIAKAGKKLKQYE